MMTPACALRTAEMASNAEAAGSRGPAAAGVQTDDIGLFAQSDDPDLAPEALPFGLKMYESLLETAPGHGPLLLSTCSGYTKYAFAYLQTEADVIRFDDVAAASMLDRRALAMYLRGRDYCLRALHQRFNGVILRLAADPVAALAKADTDDVELLYWTAAAWGAAIAIAPDRPDLLIDFPIVRALIDRAAVLDSSWGKGAIHEMLITVESLENLGGSREKARDHFDKAIALQKGATPGPYVALAATVSVAEQNRGEFVRLLGQALAIDPERDPDTRDTTLVVQRRARALRDHADSLFSN
jgi:hypothetical protein